MAMKHDMTLYGYWRSSAAYRVRIALNLKGLVYSQVPIHLVEGGGQQHSSDFWTLNPQELVPVLVDGRRVIHQSLAIAEYLDELYPDTRPLLPVGARERAQVRALAQLVACDIHPLNNLRVMQYLERELGVDKDARDAWSRHWMAIGFDACEHLLDASASTGRFCHGDAPSLADVCLVPQLYNARRFNVDLDPYPIIRRIEAACRELPEFDAARPENQPDAPAPSP
jgi:maleylacetoacetate isomerase